MAWVNRDLNEIMIRFSSSNIIKHVAEDISPSLLFSINVQHVKCDVLDDSLSTKIEENLICSYSSLICFEVSSFYLIYECVSVDLETSLFTSCTEKKSTLLKGALGEIICNTGQQSSPLLHFSPFGSVDTSSFDYQTLIGKASRNQMNIGFRIEYPKMHQRNFLSNSTMIISFGSGIRVHLNKFEDFVLHFFPKFLLILG
jgi:hypothetical protein